MKLSEMSNDTQIVSEEFGLITVSDMKNEILVYDRDCSKEKWHFALVRTWKPDARYMMDTYIERECDDMYEDWDERVHIVITKADIDKLQSALNDIFSRDNLSTVIDYGELIEIDIMTKASDSTEIA